MERASHSTKEPCILWKEPCILRVLHLTIKHQYNRTVHSVCLPPYNVSRSLERLWGLERRQRDHRERVGGWMVVEVRAQGRNNYTPHMYPHTYTKIHAGCTIWNTHTHTHKHTHTHTHTLMRDTSRTCACVDMCVAWNAEYTMQSFPATPHAYSHIFAWHTSRIPTHTYIQGTLWTIDIIYAGYNGYVCLLSLKLGFPPCLFINVDGLIYICICIYTITLMCWYICTIFISYMQGALWNIWRLLPSEVSKLVRVCCCMLQYVQNVCVRMCYSTCVCVCVCAHVPQCSTLAYTFLPVQTPPFPFET